MRTAKNWKDFEVLDCSEGEKIERWGRYTIIRPDPQIIWKTAKSGIWNNAQARYLRSSTGGGNWEFSDLPKDGWQIGYNDLKFHIQPTNFKHMGLFPEQATNWDYMDKKIRAAVSSGKKVRVLNLFAYTGGATLACANAGAEVCHVDASKGMVNWAKKNADLSGLSKKPIRWIVDDCKKFVQREIRRNEKYDGIIMDPPSYGRGPGGEVWKLENSIYELVELTAELLSEDALFFLLNSYTTGLSPSVMSYLLGVLIEKKRAGSVSSDEIGLCVKETSHPLPCGSTAIWER